MKAINVALQEGAALAIVIGCAVAIGGTQFMKFQLATYTRRLLNLVSLLLGFVTTFLMWPVHEFNAVRFFLALTVGLTAPGIYKGVTALLFWKFPQLEKYFKPST